MAKQKILSARDFYEEVTKRAYDNFMASPSSFFSVYALAYGLYHLHEWLWHYKDKEIQAQFGRSIKRKGDFWRKCIEQKVKDAGLIRDLHNAAKHVEIRYHPSSAMKHSANTFILVSGVGATGGKSGSKQPVVMEEAGRQVSFDKVAFDLMNHMTGLVDTLDPRPTVRVSTGRPTASS